MTREPVPDSERQPVGQIIDSLGVRVSQADGEIIADAVVILRVMGEDGEEWIRTGWSDGLGWVTRSGMLNVVKLYDDQEALS